MSVLEKASDLIDCLGQAGEPVTLAHVRSALGDAQVVDPSAAQRAGRARASCAAPRTAATRSDRACSTGVRPPPRRSTCGRSPNRRCAACAIELGESVHLYVRDEDTRICIAAVEARHELRPFIQLGRPLPLRAGAAGKVLLAFAEEDIQRQELQRADGRRRAPAERPGPRPGRQLDVIRAERWATSIGERENGVAAVAAPVTDSTGRVVAALCISGPTTRLTPERLEEMRAPVQACAAEVTRPPPPRLSSAQVRPSALGSHRVTAGTYVMSAGRDQQRGEVVRAPRGTPVRAGSRSPS